MTQAPRVRNWNQYNRSLIQRGSITLWFTEENMKQWYAPTGKKKKPGRPQLYSDVAIQMMLTLKYVYHLALRQCQGFVMSIMQLMQLDVKVPSYARVCVRQKNITLPTLPKLSQSIHLVVDSSGLKIFGEGEWKVRQHGVYKRRVWRKLHIGVDENSQLIVSASLTRCTGGGDAQQLPELLKQYSGAVHQVSADGAYSSYACFDFLEARRIQAAIPLPRNAIHLPGKVRQCLRDRVGVAIRRLGIKPWKIFNQYHRRSLVETAFYRLKQLLGDKLSARRFDNQQIEALLKCHILNRMTLVSSP